MKFIHFFLLMAISHVLFARADHTYKHILITNDDGIEDIDRLVALAKSVRHAADQVSIIVSSFDRSGTSNYTTLGKYQSTIEITTKYIDTLNHVAVYETPGNPADCVLIGLSGFFKDNRPDLVLSGINGGANTGTEWFGSGTIGAARMAAYLGVKSIALSGFDDDNPESFKLIPEWISHFISSSIIDELSNNQYFTIAFPKDINSITGVIFSARRIPYERPDNIVFQKINTNDEQALESTTIWIPQHIANPVDSSLKYDDSKVKEGFIVITPMTIDENDEETLKRLQQLPEKLIPQFTTTQ